jgi:prevent-host-death family protein
MTTIPQKELRNNIGEVLRRAEAGEELTITVSGRPVAVLGPIPKPEPSPWVKSEDLVDLWKLPTDPTWMRDIEEGFRGGFVDPWDDVPS